MSTRIPTDVLCDGVCKGWRAANMPSKERPGAHSCGRTVVTVLRVFGVIAVLSWLPTPAWSREVDLTLVLAIDVSGSVNSERWNLQRRGYEAAFKSPEVLQAITSGQHKAIAVTMVEWSGADHQQQVVGWTVITDPVTAAQFGSAMAEAPR